MRYRAPCSPVGELRLRKHFRNKRVLFHKVDIDVTSSCTTIKLLLRRTLQRLVLYSTY